MYHDGKIITISSVKGGVGKTTLTLNLAGIYYLMKMKVLDVNVSGNVSSSLGMARLFRVQTKNDRKQFEHQLPYSLCLSRGLLLFTL